MTQGYGNQETAEATKAEKTKTDPPRDAPSSSKAPGRPEGSDVATPGEGAASHKTEGDDADPGLG